MNFMFSKSSILVLGATVALMSCKTPNANQANVSDEAGASGSGWKACDASVERERSAKERLQKLKERFSLLRALAGIGPNTATLVTKESINFGQLPSELVASKGYPASPEGTNPAVESLKEGYSEKSLIRESVNLVQEIVAEAKGAEKESIKAEMLSELKIWMEQLSEKIESSKNNPTLRESLLLSRLVFRGGLTSIDPSNKEAFTSKSLDAEVKSIVDAGISNEALLKELAFVQLLLKSSEEASSNSKIKEVLTAAGAQITKRASQANVLAGVNLDAVHSTDIYCKRAGGCSDRKGDVVEGSKNDSSRLLEKINAEVEAREIRNEKLKFVYASKFPKGATRQEIIEGSERIEKAMEKTGVKPSERKAMEVKGRR